MDNQLSMDFGSEVNLSDRPRTLKEVAAYYGVSARVVRGWLCCHQLRDLAYRRGTGRGYYFTVAELRRMAEVLGE